MHKHFHVSWYLDTFVSEYMPSKFSMTNYVKFMQSGSKERLPYVVCLWDSPISMMLTAVLLFHFTSKQFFMKHWLSNHINWRTVKYKIFRRFISISNSQTFHKMLISTGRVFQRSLNVPYITLVPEHKQRNKVFQ